MRSSKVSERSHSNSSRSSHSSFRSNKTSASARDKAIEERARLAALKIESEFLLQSQQEEIEKQQLEMKADRLEVEKEIAMAEARAKVYEDHIDINCIQGVQTCNQTHLSNKIPAQDKFCVNDHTSAQKDNLCNTSQHLDQLCKHLNVRSKQPLHPGSQSQIPVKVVKSVNDDTTAEKETKLESNSNTSKHLDDLCKLLKVQSAPDIDMDYFSGDPLDYQYFLSLFEELIEKKVDDPLGRLARLIKYTRGEAKELIQHCIQMPQPDGFNLAKDLLAKEYGDPHKVTAAYMKELNTWKVIRTGDLKELNPISTRLFRAP